MAERAVSRDGPVPASEALAEFVPATQSELARWIADNAAGARAALVPAGGRTSMNFGCPARRTGIPVSTTSLARVIDYPARDMTVTIEAGIRVDQLAELLHDERQRLPVDVPQAHRATLGGVLACNASGPRRYGQGTIRDYVIGISAIDASGRFFKAGGRVVKNVAGYDLCKMLVGSLGTLAVITQVTLKVRPAPEASAMLWATFDHLAAAEQALERLNTSAARPAAIELLDSRAASAIAGEAGLDLPTHRSVLCLGVEGTRREIDWQVETLRSELSPHGPHEMPVVGPDNAAKLWFALTEFQVASDDPLSFKANLLPSRTVEFVRQAEGAGCAVQAHAGSGIVIGHLPDTVSSASAAAALLGPLRGLARGCRGNLVILQCDESWKSELPVFGDAEPAWPLMRRLKAELDPDDLLNPGKLFAA